MNHSLYENKVNFAQVIEQVEFSQKKKKHSDKILQYYKNNLSFLFLTKIKSLLETRNLNCFCEY